MYPTMKPRLLPSLDVRISLKRRLVSPLPVRALSQTFHTNLISPLFQAKHLSSIYLLPKITGENNGKKKKKKITLSCLNIIYSLEK